MNAQERVSEERVEGERFFYGWFIVGILFFISLIDGGFTYIFSAFLKPLSQEFSWTRAETAGAFSLYCSPLVVGHDFGTRSFGALAGMVGTVALTLGGAAGPVVAGAMYDKTGSYFLAFLLCVVVFLVGATAAFVTTKPGRR